MVYIDISLEDKYSTIIPNLQCTGTYSYQSPPAVVFNITFYPTKLHNVLLSVSIRCMKLVHAVRMLYHLMLDKLLNVTLLYMMHNAMTWVGIAKR